VVVAPVDEQDINRRFSQSARGAQTSEAAADDDDPGLHSEYNDLIWNMTYRLMSPPMITLTQAPMMSDDTIDTSCA
jgi:hypothetical protein